MFIARNSFLILLALSSSYSFAHQLTTDNKDALEQKSSTTPAAINKQREQTTLCYLDQLVTMATANLAKEEAVLLTLIRERNQATNNSGNPTPEYLEAINESEIDLAVISKCLESILAKKSILASLHDNITQLKKSNLSPRRYFVSRQELYRNLYEGSPIIEE